MTAITTYGPIGHTSDEEFRRWVKDFSDGLQAVGLVKTADTGQINLDTATRPTAINTNAGYEIFRFDDALQATAPVFLKFFYGTGTSVTSPRMTMIVARATDGAGGVTQTIANAFINVQSTTSLTPTLDKVSFFSYNEYGLSVFFKSSQSGSTSDALTSYFHVGRHSDINTTEPTATSIHTISTYGNTSTSSMSQFNTYSYETNSLRSIANSTSSFYFQFPLGITSASLNNGEVTAYRSYEVVDDTKMRMNNLLLTASKTEVSPYTMYDITDHLGVTRKYVCLYNLPVPGGIPSSATWQGWLLMLYE